MSTAEWARGESTVEDLHAAMRRLCRAGEVMVRGERLRVEKELLRAGGSLAPPGLTERGTPPHSAWVVKCLNEAAARECAAALRYGAGLWTWCNTPPQPLRR